jgi:succinyl-diaminopimelate desuccinylase
MMCAVHDVAAQDRVRVHFVCVSDEESEETDDRGSDQAVKDGYLGDFAITGEPTDLHIGIQAKGVLAMRIQVTGTAAHGSTPWVGDNAVLKAIDTFRQIESLPFARESSDLFDRPSINLGRIVGGDALNKVPDLCAIDVDIRYLPGQDPEAIRAAVEDFPDVHVVKVFHRQPVIIERDDPYVQALGTAISRVAEPTSERLGVGRDGASDAISFIEAGVPAVECGPAGGGHHGPEEWVSIRSLGQYRAALVEFVKLLPAHLEGGERRLRIA